jgi:hypothetical protein
MIWGVPHFRKPPCIHRSMAKNNLVLEYPSTIGLPICLMIYPNLCCLEPSHLAVYDPLIWGYSVHCMCHGQKKINPLGFMYPQKKGFRSWDGPLTVHENPRISQILPQKILNPYYHYCPINTWTSSGPLWNHCDHYYHWIVSWYSLLSH